ncbi:MAG: RHS repeat-associated core domain-containing protein, partial [Actinomycetota bacterium]|nr:RHS repeat-associated core domain-containing protein [Actinomycetota bacterium]
TRLMVDALGDLAEVNDIPLLWDPTGVVSQLRWAGGTAVIGRDEPWATIDPSGAASWLDVDWQETVGDSSRDPWGADGQATAPVGADPVRLGWRGEVEVDGLVWLRHRPYDPHTRTFLSTDPLPGLPGTATAANPYHYANNDPIGFSDPLGLRPLTDADLRAYRDAAGRNLFERGGDWAQDNWEYLAAGAAVVGGVALMATGVGAPAGLALLAAAGGGALIGAGASVGVQKFTTGGVDWGRVGIDAAIGGAAGPIGAGAAAATRLGSPLLRGAVAGATESLTAGAATRAAYGENPFNPPAMVKDLFLGGTPGALGGRLGAKPAPRKPLFSQTTASPVFAHGPFRGETIGAMADALRAGKVAPEQLPIDVVVRNGQTIALNTRSTLALRRAGIDPSEWVVRDLTGDPFFEGLLTERLARNKLTDGIDYIRITGAGPNASSLR